MPIFGLLRLQRRGGRPVALVGGGTGMIGDPSGRSSERNLLDRETLEANVVALRGQLERFLDFSPGAGGAVMVNNLDWLGELRLIDFLRDTGKHFTIPYMLAKDSVQVRLERGLSFTEFSYMLLQAYDFAHLHRTMGVELQMGGADQWGNITAGLELIRRLAGADEGAEPAHGLAYKLLLNPSGTKFGKSETGESIWLDPNRTSPYAFYQYWLNTDDRDVGTYLRWFTELSRERDRGARGGGRIASGAPIGPAGAGPRHHRAHPWRGRGGRRRSPIPRPCSRAQPSSIPRSCGRCSSRLAGSPSSRRPWPVEPPSCWPRPASSRHAAKRGGRSRPAA